MESLVNDSVIACDKITDTSEIVSIDSINKKAKYKIDYYIFHNTLVINKFKTIFQIIQFIHIHTLLIFIAFNCYYIKHWLK